VPYLQTITHRPPSRWSRVREAVRSFSLSGLSLKDPTLNRYFDMGVRTDAGVSVTEASALTYSPVWQAVSLIAGDVGSLPLIFYKKLTNGGKERYTAHPLYSLLHDTPNPEMTSMVWRETQQAHAMTWGNAYSEIERDGAGRPVALWPLLPSQVTPFRERGMLRYRVASFEGQPDVILDARDMLHVPGLGFDGICGYGVVRQARQSLGLLAASERFGATFFGNGTTFGGALKHPKVLGDKATKNLRESMNGYHQGPDKAHRFLILEEGMDYVKFGVDPNDAQFLETRQFQIAEVARWFNLPVSKLREMENSSVRANIEQEALDYVISTLRPWLVRWEQEMKRKLISPLERNLQDIEFNIAGLLRGDLSSRYSAYAVGRQWGWLSANEIRALENLNPIADGDKYLSPINMVPADRVDEVIDKQVEPTPAPQPATPAPAASEGEGDSRAVTELLLRLEAQATTIGELQARAEVERLSLSALQAERDGLAGELGAEKAARAVDTQCFVDNSEAWRASREAWKTREAEIAADLAAERSAHEATTARASGLAVTVTEQEAEIGTLLENLTAASTALEEAKHLRAEAEASVQEARAETAAAIVRAEDAEAARQHAEAAQATAERQATEATRRATEAQEARQAAEDARDAAVKTLADRLAAVISANRTVAVDTLARLVVLESDRARKQAASPVKLRAWMQTFYPQHEQVCTDRLTPVMAAHLALIGSAADPVEAARALAQEHIRESRVQLEAVAELGHAEDMAGVLAQVTDRWERSRPETVADRLMRAEIAHVRELR
jgi:HK97 family phage portal protein